jgi:hypothetical protein
MTDALLETDPHAYGARWAARQENIDAADQRNHDYQTELRNQINAEKATPTPDFDKIKELERTLEVTAGIYYD